MFDGKAFGAEIVGVVKAHVERSVAPLLTQMEAMRSEIAALKSTQIDADDLDSRLKNFSALLKDEREVARAEGKEKRKAALAELKSGLLADCETIVSEKIAAIPAPKEIDPNTVANMVAAGFDEDLAKVRIEIAEVKEAIPQPPVMPDFPAMISGAIAESEAKALADRDLLADAIAAVDVAYKQAIADIPPVLEPAIMPDIPALIAEAVSAIPDAADLKAMVNEAVAAIPAAENGKDVDPEIVAALVKETVERAVAAIPVPNPGAPGADGVTLQELLPVIGQEVAKAVSAIPVPTNGNDGADVVDLLIDREGNLVASLSNGRTKVLGPIIGKDADIEPLERTIAERLAGLPEPKEIDQGLVARFVAEELARISKDITPAEEFAPDEVAANVSLAVKMMAEMPQTVSTHQRSDAPPINVYSNTTLPEIKFPENMVNVSMPEMTVAAPIVNVDPVVNNVMPPAEASKKRKEITTVTGWDKSGRITSFEKTEVD